MSEKEWRALSTVRFKAISPGRKDKKVSTSIRQTFYMQKTAHPKLLNHCPTDACGVKHQDGVRVKYTELNGRRTHCSQEGRGNLHSKDGETEAKGA